MQYFVDDCQNVQLSQSFFLKYVFLLCVITEIYDCFSLPTSKMYDCLTNPIIGHCTKCNFLEIALFSKFVLK